MAGTVIAASLAATITGGSVVAGERDTRTAGEDPVPVVAHAVICKPDLLRCRDLATDDMVYDDVPTCRDELPELKKELRPIGTQRSDIVLARCRYALLTNGRQASGHDMRRLAHTTPQATRRHGFGR